MGITVTQLIRNLISIKILFNSTKYILNTSFFTLDTLKIFRIIKRSEKEKIEEIP